MLLLRAYPAGFREAYGREMLQLFHDQRREAGARRMQFWSAVVWDVICSAPGLRFESFCASWTGNMPTGGRKMIIMGILAVLIGGLEILNSLLEVFAGGFAGRSAETVLALVLAVLSSVLLLLAGIALLARARRAATLTRGAAFACLVVFAAIAALHPMFSVAATALGVGFPIALLIFLYWNPRGGRSTSVA